MGIDPEEADDRAIRQPYQEKPVKLALHPYRLCFAGQAWYSLPGRRREAAQDVPDRPLPIPADDRRGGPAAREVQPGRILRQRLGRFPRQGVLRRGNRVHQGGGRLGDGDPLAQDPGS